MTLNLNTLLIETGGRRILIEAGAAQTMGPNGGRLFDNLAAIGLTRDDIDLVVISHTHPDRVGNLRTADGDKAFPRAVVYVPKADWTFFVQGDPDLSYLPVSPDFRRRLGKRSSAASSRSRVMWSSIRPAARSFPASPRCRAAAIPRGWCHSWSTRERINSC
jgi:glyoxylase-like metal-dependent hydrolase (beta-lactamase superfamily II)